MTSGLVDPIAPTQSVIGWIIANREQVAIGPAVAAVIVGVMLVARFVGRRMVASEQEGEPMGWRHVIGRVLAKTSILFMVMVAIAIVSNYATPPPSAQRLVDAGFTILFALQAAIWAKELVLALISRRVSTTQDGGALVNAMALIRVLVSFTLFALAIIFILDNLGANVTALVAGLGIGGIAIGLAAQGIFSDLFAALSILFDRPFRRGDTIRFGESVGTVERIGLKTTRLRALSGEDIVMANTQLLEQEIRNLAEGQSRRTTLNFGVIYQTPPDKLAEIPEIARSAIEGRRGCTFVRCALTGFGDSGLDHELLYDTESVDLNVVAAERSAIMMEIIREFAVRKIDFAYPTQTTFTAAPDGTMIMPYPPRPARG